uniref:ZP domain-containing protein n=1 Tax=Schistosoma curassoni TaxID=6186 RepID=A0A183K388_9TREM
MIEFTLGKLCFPDIFNDFGHTYNVLKNEVNGNNLIVEHCVLVPCSNITDCSSEFD